MADFLPPSILFFMQGLPFLEPANFAGTVTAFFDKAQAMSPALNSYYDTPATSAALSTKLSTWAALCAGALALMALAP